MTKRESTASCKTLESWRSVQSSYFFSYSQILCKISPQLFVQDISCHARGTCTRPNNFTALWRRLFIHLLIGIGCKKDVDGGHVFIKFSWPFEMKTLIHLLIGIGCKKDVDGTVFLSKFFYLSRPFEKKRYLNMFVWCCMKELIIFSSGDNRQHYRSYCWYQLPSWTIRGMMFCTLPWNHRLIRAHVLMSWRMEW
jgi:hypothetical protein